MSVVGARARMSGFTLLELTIALLLLALMSGVLFGSLRLSSDSWERGEAKTERTNEMRLTEEFLRKTLTSQHPLRLHKATGRPVVFAGERDTLSFAAAVPGRAGGGMYYFRLALDAAGDDRRLMLLRMIPDTDATELPEFRDPESSTLARGITELKLAYFGRDPDATDASDPSWRDHWDDKQRIPDLIRIDVTPKTGPAWPSLIVEPRIAPEAGCRAIDPLGRRCQGN